MPNVNFRRFIKITVAPVLKGLLDGLGHEVAIFDGRGQLVYGDDRHGMYTRKYDVTLEGEVIGHTMGEPRTYWVPKVLNYLAEEHVAAERMEQELVGETLKAMDLKEELREAKDSLARAEDALRRLTQKP